MAYLESEKSPLIDSPIIEEDPLANTKIHAPPPLPIWRLVLLTICFLGVQFGWAIQIAYTTPLFLELGVPKTLVSFVWLAGPVSGLIVQPTVGVISDRCTISWGRRRPFIVFGTLFIVIAMLIISNASTVGRWMGDTATHNPAAITLAVIGFWILDLSNNTVQGPCRALLVDVAPPEQHNLGGGLFSFMLGLGNLIGYFLGSQHLAKAFPFLQTDLRALFTLAMITLVTCVSATVLFTSERPLSKEETKNVENPFVKIFKGLMNMPPAMVRVCLVQFFTWVGWFTFFLYITVWVGEYVYKGDPNAKEGPMKELFDKGVKWGSLCLTAEAGVTMVFSPLVPYLVHFFGVRIVYAFGQLVFAVCLLLPIWVQSKWGAMILIAGCGIPWSIVMILPFSLVAMSVKDTESGMYMGVLNIFVVIPQLVVALGIGAILKVAHGNLAVALAVGGGSSVIAAALCFFLIVKKGGPEFISINNGGGGH